MLAIANGQVSLASAAHACKNILCYTRYSIVQKLSTYVTNRVLKWFEDMIDLKTAHSKRQSKQTSTYLNKNFEFQ